MTNEEQKLKEKIDILEERIKKLENPTQSKTVNRFIDIENKQFLKVENLIIKYIETVATSEPSILTNTIILWKDTTNNKYYLKANFNGTAKKIELT
jgi:hypothetical protein